MMDELVKSWAIEYALFEQQLFVDRGSLLIDAIRISQVGTTD